MKVNVKRKITGPDAPALGPVLTISGTALTVTLDRPATGPTRIDYYELDRSDGGPYVNIATGLSIFGAGNAYPDTGLLPSTLYYYRCRAVDTTGRASAYSTAQGTTSAGATNQAPVWDSTVAISIQAGQSASIASYCTDPEGSALSFTRTDSSPAGVTVSLSGLVTVDSSVAPSAAYTITVQASDGALTASKDISLTVTAAPTLTRTGIIYTLDFGQFATTAFNPQQSAFTAGYSLAVTDSRNSADIRHIAQTGQTFSTACELAGYHALPHLEVVNSSPAHPSGSGFVGRLTLYYSEVDYSTGNYQ